MRMTALALCALVACAGTQTSQVGPYVKHVARNGDWLAIYKCIIVLDDSDLVERGCTVEQIPLASIPQQMPPAAAQPPGMQGTPIAPPAMPPRK